MRFDVIEHVARAIHCAAFAPRNADEAARRIPSPGWCWEKCSDQHREFAIQQAQAAIIAYEECRVDRRALEEIGGEDG
jgi:hypothetical protein